MQKKIRVGILFGGKSAEHEVSIQSAKNVLAALDKEKFEPVLIAIDKTGGWHLEDPKTLLEAPDIKSLKAVEAQKNNEVVWAQGGARGQLVSASDGARAANHVDVVFPVLHGPFGEDGTVQGLFKLAGVPFVGAGVLGSAVGMDKDVMKRLLRDAGVPIAKFLVFSREQIPPIRFEDLTAELAAPLFVKPANLGSSIGINKVRSEEEFNNAVQDAFQYDHKILIEEYIEGREIECSVLGNESPIASLPGEIISRHEFYTYAAKYLDENGAILEVPAKISHKKISEIQKLSVLVFQILCLEGMARVDFFLKSNGDVILNEVNTIPGFTKISMYPKLWGVSGISYSELISRLIYLAIERFDSEKKLKISYQPFAPKYLIPEVPFYGQDWDLARWQELGFRSYEDAEYWRRSSCGVLSLKMAIDAGRLKKSEPLSPAIIDYIKKGQEIGAYTDAKGWSHQGLVNLAREFGAQAVAKSYVNEEEIKNMLLSSVLPIISIKWNFETVKSLKERIFFWKKFGGHLAVVVGFEEERGIRGFYVHHTSKNTEQNSERRFIPIHQFHDSYTGRCIAVGTN